MILKLMKKIDKIFTKKYKKIFYKKPFELFKIFIMWNNIFDDDDNAGNIMNIKLLDIINKMFNSIFIENLGVIKLDKHLFGLVEKYNIIQKKKNSKNKTCKETIDNKHCNKHCNTDTDDTNSNTSD